MYKRILVTLDGSKLAELALPYAEELARALNSEVVLIYVTKPAESQYRHVHQAYIEKMAKQTKSHLKESTKVKVKPVELLGEPSKEIVNYVEQNDISLVVMATHGRTGIMLWPMGSIASKVLRGISMPVGGTSVPILLIRANGTRYEVVSGARLNRILVPLDGSCKSEATLPYVGELAKQLKPEVILLQVVEPGQHIHTVGGLDYVPLLEHEVERMKAEAKAYLQKAGEGLMGVKGTIRIEVRTGDPAHEIIKFAKEVNADLMAISTHGKSGFREWMFGGVTRKILQVVNTNILVVRAPVVKK